MGQAMETQGTGQTWHLRLVKEGRLSKADKYNRPARGESCYRKNQAGQAWRFFRQGGHGRLPGGSIVEGKEA